MCDTPDNRSQACMHSWAKIALAIALGRPASTSMAVTCQGATSFQVLGEASGIQGADYSIIARKLKRILWLESCSMGQIAGR